ncbi:hypothetical protein DFH06DRAFT_1467323 [Mycena polygramma]|nr:hypothetical protein DFH06DRAFT_1467323 [Mycena polygramma]
MAFQTSIFNSVPTEILREIASSIDTSHDKAALCQVSRLLNLVTSPVLYRHLHLDTVERTLDCLHALLQYPKRHDQVRSLRIVIDAPAGRACDYVPTDIIHPLETALRTLPNLEHFHLRVPEFTDAFLLIFATLVLPALRSFSSYHTGSFSPILPSFVVRHAPHLTHLDLIRPWIAPPAASVLPPPCDLPLLNLPHLRVYRGCASHAARLRVHSRTLLRADLWDAPNYTDLDTLFLALGDAADPRTFSLTFLWDGPQTALFAPLAANLPQTRTLIVGPFIGGHRPLSKHAVEVIAEALDSFVCLEQFDFDNVSVRESENSPRVGDWLALTDWSERCPTLVRSRLHCRNWARHTAGWSLVL